MSCILRFGGDHLDLSALIDSISMSPDRVWSRGEPKFASLPNSSKNKNSGFTFLASDADFDEFDLQVVDATSFLRTNREDILRISSNDNIEYGVLDFGVSLRDVADVFTPDFLEAIAGLNVEVAISRYPGEDDN